MDISLLFENTEWISWQFYLSTFIFIIFCYLIGSINFARILSKITEIDLGSEGSKNFGATNAGRVFGAWGFIFVFIGDVAKVFLAGGIMILFNRVILSDFFSYANMAFASFFLVVGHCYPIYFNFKGGKGVATGMAILFLINWAFALISLTAWLITMYFSRKVFLSSIVSNIVASILIVFQIFFPAHLLLPEAITWGAVSCVWMMTILVIWKHKINIEQMKENTKTKE